MQRRCPRAVLRLETSRNGEKLAETLTGSHREDGVGLGGKPGEVQAPGAQGGQSPWEQKEELAG